MKKILVLSLIILLLPVLALSGCGSTKDGSLKFDFSFDKDTEGWTGDFTDLPFEFKHEYELEFEHADLPAGLVGKGLKIGGQNNSDDLFMYVKKQLTGLKKDTTYVVKFKVNFATNAPAGAVGIGGPPGEAVWVKVGASHQEPVPVQDASGFIHLNLDKGSQNGGGKDAVQLGDVAKEVNEEFDVYELKTLDNFASPMEVTTDKDGNLWIFVGTDSGFEGKTVLYYNSIEVMLEAK
jgi:hypothetical protein